MHCQDLNLALDAAKVTGTPLPLGTGAVKMYTELVEQGYADKDFSVVYEYLVKKSKNKKSKK